MHDLSLLKASKGLYHGYSKTPEKHLKKIFDNLVFTGEDKLLDIGCGKGNVLRIAAEYPFKEVAGIEIDAKLIPMQKIMRSDRTDIIDMPVRCWIGNHAVNPLWLLNEGYSISGNGLNGHDNDGIRKINMEKSEWLCRCGLYDYLPELRKEVDFVINSINKDGVYTGGIYEKEFKGWSPYFGAQLETDWKARIRKQCDVTFRALLIGHYAGVL